MDKAKVRRIEPEETQRKLASGKAMLVCGYESDEKFASVHLEGAISFNQFRERLPDLSRDQEIIFYCA